MLLAVVVRCRSMYEAYLLLHGKNISSLLFLRYTLYTKYQKRQIFTEKMIRGGRLSNLG